MIPILLFAFAAGPADAAALFPDKTLAYAEVRDPAAVADVLRGWAEKTPLADAPKLLFDRKDAVKEHRLLPGLPAVAWAGLLASPELLGELRHLPGAGVGLIGFGKGHEPRWAGVVLLGDRPLPNFAARQWVCTEAFRRVAVVHGVPVVQYRGFPQPSNGDDGRPLPLENPKPTEGPHEFTAAFAPGLLAVGSDVAAVSEVVGRFLGKVSTPTLDRAERFRAFAADRAKPGLFAYLAPAELHAGMTAAAKANHPVMLPEPLAYLTFLLNPATLPDAAVTLTVAADDIRLSVFAPKAGPSPVGKLCAGPAVPLPVPATAAMTFGTTATAVEVLAVADALAKAGGEIGKLPSDRVAAAEFPAVRGVGLVFPDVQEPPKDAPHWPVIVLCVKDDAAADELIARIPKLAAAVESSELVGTVKVRAVQTPRGVLHYARGGGAVTFGFDRGWVGKVAAAAPQVGHSLSLSKLFGTTFSGKAGDVVPVSALAFAALEPLPPVTVTTTGGSGWRVEARFTGFLPNLPAASAKGVAWLEAAAAAAGGNPNAAPRGIIDR